MASMAAWMSGSRDENLRQAGQTRGHLIRVGRVIQLGLVLTAARPAVDQCVCK